MLIWTCLLEKHTAEVDVIAFKELYILLRFNQIVIFWHSH